MKILNITSLDTGGAGIAAIRLHRALREAGEESKLLLMFNKKAVEESYQFNDYKNPGAVGNTLHFFRAAFYPGINKLKMLGRKGEFEIFSPPQSAFDLTSHPLFKWADVVNLHWVPYFLDWRTFFRRADRPVVWTFHDMFPFSGGCHVTFGCKKFMEDCSDCPQLQGTINPDFSKKYLNIKKEGMTTAKNLTVVTPSRWLGETSAASPLFSPFPHEVINNGIDSQKFTRHDPTEARRELGIPEGRRVLLFVSDKLDRWYKGYRVILEAFGKLSGRSDVLLVSLGESAGIDIPEGLPLHELGFIAGEEKISMVYSAANAFVTPSLADNYPNTVVESLMCGTPVVGFPIGGIKEMVDHGENGILCEEPNSDSLAKSLNDFLDNKYYFDNLKIRKNSIGQRDHLVMANKYIELYEHMINTKSE
ncbi:MAG: glycosyltransferase [Candidatus Kapaibacterium sp.]